jgi:hypothetical protein
MLRAAEPDLSLATTLLHAVRDDPAAARLWKRLTSDSLTMDERIDSSLVVQRLTQINSAYPLRRLEVHLALPELLPALGAATTLEAVYISSLPTDFKARIFEQLKAVPSLREINLNDVPIDAALELLRSRTNWKRIRLPNQKQDFKKAAALATHNKAAFILESVHYEELEGLALWLANPHLTALHIPNGAVPHSILAELSGRPNLINLVLAPRVSLLARCSSFFERD